MGGNSGSRPDPQVEEFKNSYALQERIHDERLGELTLLRHKETGELLALKQTQTTSEEEDGKLMQ